MDLPLIQYPPQEYIETESGNKVSRKSVITGSQNITLAGKSIIQSQCILRGDLCRRLSTGVQQSTRAITIGKYTTIAQRTTVRPPCKFHSNTFNYFPIKIGDYVFIHGDSVVQAAFIGSFVNIGRACVIGQFCIIKDCVQIMDNTVLPPYTVVAPFSIYGGNPGKLLGELPESIQQVYEEQSIEYYDKFVPYQDP